MIELAFPWALLLLPLPWLVYRFVPPWRERMPALRFPFFRRIAEAAGAEPRAGSVIQARRRLQMAVAIVVWVLIVLALAWPERVGEPIEIEKAARDLVLAVDISGSMDQRDFATGDGSRIQRLEAVKQVVGEFIEARDGDRVSLIVFGSQAFMQSPFTEDLETVRDLLGQTEVGMAGPHTVIGDAIGLGIRAFDSSEIEQRLMILLSDGADTGSRMSPVNAAEIAASKGVQIFTIGVGDPEATGEDRMDPAALEDIARRAGGKFYFAGDEAGLAEVYAEIDALTPRQVETLSWRPREPLGHWPMGLAALIALATAGWLEWRTSRRVAA
ncbi:MAG: VWA domain-containing protein [Hyphomicrobiales bacterium]|nr:VWA domain-containing protein [Hyphomicrobiales bacterium]